MSRQHIGSIEWARQTDGLLSSRRERAAMFQQAARYAVHSLSSKVPASLGRPRRPRARLDLEKLRFPDTRAAKDAEAMIGEQLAPVWVQHSFRTYVWAYVIGHHDGLKFDEEVLYVASLLHDLSLADSNIAVRQRCFSLSAAECAASLTDRAGWSGERQHLISDAITRHVNLWIPPAEEPEAYLLHVGTKLDVVGLRYTDLDPRLVKDVLARYPRSNFKSTFRPKMRAHGAAVPDSRAGFYARHFSSDKRRARAPFSE
jgi:hypothetical protein